MVVYRSYIQVILTRCEGGLLQCLGADCWLMGVMEFSSQALIFCSDYFPLLIKWGDWCQGQATQTLTLIFNLLALPKLQGWGIYKLKLAKTADKYTGHNIRTTHGPEPGRKQGTDGNQHYYEKPTLKYHKNKYCNPSSTLKWCQIYCSWMHFLAQKC